MCFSCLSSKRAISKGDDMPPATGEVPWTKRISEQIQEGIANPEVSDGKLISNVIHRLRELCKSLTDGQRSEIEDIIQTDLGKVHKRLSDMRKRIRTHMEGTAKVLKKHWADLIQNIKDGDGEDGEQEAADWVLQNYDELMQPRLLHQSSLTSSPQSTNYFKWEKSLKNTITKEAIMEVFSNSFPNQDIYDNLVDIEASTDGEHKDTSKSGYDWETVTQDKLIVLDERRDITPSRSDGPEELRYNRDWKARSAPALHQPAVIITSPALWNDDFNIEDRPHKSGIGTEVEKKPRLYTSSSYIYNADGSIKKQPPLTPIGRQRIQIFKNKNFEIRLGWDIDVVQFSEIPEVAGKPLLVLGHYIIKQAGLDNHINLDINRLDNWLTSIEEAYYDNPYHNHLHAADVMCSMYFWFRSMLFRDNMTSLDLLGSLMAAAAHDVGHDAVNNRFHVLTRSKLSTRYNDKSPLENYHTAVAFELLYHPDNNWLYSFEKAEQNYMRQLIINLILATDNTYHTTHQKNLTSLMNSVDILKSSANPAVKLRVKDDTKAKEGSAQSPQSRVPGEPCEKVMMLKAGLHLADIANPAKPNHISVYWAKRVTEEFFEQGDKEQARGMVISPLCDRKTSNMEQGQKSFILYVVMPIFKPWAKLMPEAQIAIDHLEKNLEFWDKRRNSGFLRKELFVELNKKVKERMSRREEMKQFKGKGVLLAKLAHVTVDTKPTAG